MLIKYIISLFRKWESVLFISSSAIVQIAYFLIKQKYPELFEKIRNLEIFLLFYLGFSLVYAGYQVFKDENNDKVRLEKKYLDITNSKPKLKLYSIKAFSKEEWEDEMTVTIPTFKENGIENFIEGRKRIWEDYDELFRVKNPSPSMIKDEYENGEIPNSPYILHNENKKMYFNYLAELETSLTKMKRDLFFLMDCFLLKLTIKNIGNMNSSESLVNLSCKQLRVFNGIRKNDLIKTITDFTLPNFPNIESLNEFVNNSAYSLMHKSIDNSVSSIVENVFGWKVCLHFEYLSNIKNHPDFLHYGSQRLGSLIDIKKLEVPSLTQKIGSNELLTLFVKIESNDINEIDINYEVYEPNIIGGDKDCFVIKILRDE